MSRPVENLGLFGPRSYIKLKGRPGEERLVYYKPTPNREDLKDGALLIGFISWLTGALLLCMFTALFIGMLTVATGDPVFVFGFPVAVIWYSIFFYRNSLKIISYNSFTQVPGFNDEDGQKLLAATAINKNGNPRYLTLREEYALNQYAKEKNKKTHTKTVKSKDAKFHKFILDNYGADVQTSKLALKANKNKRPDEVLNSSETVYKLDREEREDAYTYIKNNIYLINSNNHPNYLALLTGVFENFDNLNESEKRNFVEILAILKSNIETYYSMLSIVSCDSEVALDAREGLDALIDVMFKPITRMANRFVESKRDAILLDTIYVNNKYGKLETI